MANKKGAIKLGILAAVIALVITLAVFVIASEQDDELSQLEQDLIDSGYDWLDLQVNLNIDDNLMLSIDNKMYTTYNGN